MYRVELSDGKRVWQSGRANKCLRNVIFTRRASSGVDANNALLGVVVVEWDFFCSAFCSPSILLLHLS